MDDNIINILCSLGGTLIGGGLSLLGSFLASEKESKKDDKQWLRENRLELYVELVDILEACDIFIGSISTDCKKGFVDVKELRKYLHTANEYIDSNRGKLFLFLPSKIYKKTISFRSQVYSIITNEELQNVDFEDITNSEICKVVQYAKEINIDLQKELGVYNIVEGKKCQK